MKNEFKITKKTLLNSVNNDMTSYSQYLVNFRVYATAEKHSYWQLKTVILVYNDSVFEYADTDYLSKKDYSMYESELISLDIECLVEAAKDIKDLYKDCNDTIDNYNKQNSGYCYCY